MKSYHIYLEDKCLFKNLNQEEFDVVWNKIYKSYWTEDLTYSCCEADKVEQMESSYYTVTFVIDIISECIIIGVTKQITS